jgi:hypothetical protein
MEHMKNQNILAIAAIKNDVFADRDASNSGSQIIATVVPEKGAWQEWRFGRRLHLLGAARLPRSRFQLRRNAKYRRVPLPPRG